MEELLTLALNLMGTFAFGLSGGILAVRKQMDLFGVLVLAVATWLGGGIMRDINDRSYSTRYIERLAVPSGCGFGWNPGFRLVQ